MLASRQKIRSQAEGGRATAWLAFSCWQDFRDKCRAFRKSRLLLQLPYLLVRLIVGLLLELIGKIVLLLIAGFAWVMSRVVKPAGGGAGKVLLSPIVRLSTAFFGGLSRAYPKTIRWSLDHPVLMVIGVVACGVITWEAARRLGTELLPEVHQGEFTFEVNLPVGTPLEKTIATLESVEKTILDHREDIRSLIVTFGFDATNIKRSDEGEHSARFKVILESGPDPVAIEERVVGRLRGYFDRIPDVQLRVVRPVLFSSKSPIVVEIEGDDLGKLKALSMQAE
jgi:HAE1 family hydrophobic/amphiphilic exporter-1